jgi:mannose-1-phosphate guanylyltransferase
MTQDMPSDLAVVIMAGGAGTRFWPVSVEAKPKQFLTLFGERSLLQLSYDRVAGLVPVERVLVLTSASFVDLVHEQLPEIPRANVVGEPMRRDTAAAVALAALICRERFGEAAAMAVLTADHLIQPVEAFQRTLLSAVAGARQSEALYTFGIKPSYPATGYGYLQRGGPVEVEGEVPHYELLRFKEKPDLDTAREYVDSGEFYWNSGMFVWTVAAIMEQLRRHLPDHLDQLQEAVQHDGTPRWGAALTAAFEQLQPISIDFGLMEKADNVRCVASRFDWSDVGGWLALEQFLARDDAANAHRGRLLAQEARHNLVFCEDPDEAVALVGVEDLVVVRAAGRTLVVHRDKTEMIKALVKTLEQDLK